MYFLFVSATAAASATPPRWASLPATTKPVAISFNETLAGFSSYGGSPDDTIATFDAAYIVRLFYE
jgi:hypothetical protein